MYKALYRKWRPMTFDDVISQEYTTEALKNQIISGKTAHAYLFTGSRGTGKTTCARILAKAVNCRNMKDGNPCLECDICRDADSGALTDIVEIDAASNNGVDNIRDLRDAAVYTPERGAFKIYIIDEVHMLSAGAFNALLKIMEEPPPYVKFILATTEIHKVPATIVSRCQRYDFRRIKPEDIAKRISYIASQEDINLTEDGAAMIAKLADGGMRDAVSLLDQCSVCAEKIDAEAVSNAAGIAGRDYLYDLLDAITDSDTAKALSITASLYDMSKDLARLCDELIMQFRNVMLIKASPENAEKLIVCMPDELQRLKAAAEKSDLSAVMDRLSALQECRDRMQNAMNKRVEFEMSLIKLCGNVKNTPESIDNSEIYDKIKQLEDKINSAPRAVQNAAHMPEQPEILEASAAPADEKIIPTVDLKKLRPEDIRPCDRWGEILDEFKQINPAVAGSLDGSFAGTAGNYIFITAQNRFFMDLFKVKENAASLGAAIAKVLGQRFIIKAKCATTVTEQKNLAESLIKKAVESQIETSVENQ
ncbi:MAG: DNA polymerase III subunit gamma/tau [Ruminococcus sp.]|uniref:DNA polymerase III subunit gamma/tau n=1 Tax=Ruminococcus sp. TaxID=41978 RepID=UPI0025EF9B73|nr:DNA polymerase III subunit gamma/tau [Ruminococcus sp.]MBR5682428.1 DNA polymerase III subunit gamma/tau [Ruminococcus sp.]